MKKKKEKPIIKFEKGNGMVLYSNGGHLGIMPLIPAIKPMEQIEKIILDLKSENKRLKDLIIKLEWIEDLETGVKFCHICYSQKVDGHDTDCEIKKVL